MNDEDLIVSFLSRFYEKDSISEEEFAGGKIDELSKKFNFLKIARKISGSLVLKELLYNSEIYHLLFSNDKFVGFSAIHINGECVELSSLKVGQKYQGCGFGRVLMENIIQIGMQNRQISYIHVDLDETYNPKEFYRSFGFEVFGNEARLKLR